MTEPRIPIKTKFLSKIELFLLNTMNFLVKFKPQTEELEKDLLSGKVDTVIVSTIEKNGNIREQAFENFSFLEDQIEAEKRDCYVFSIVSFLYGSETLEDVFQHYTGKIYYTLDKYSELKKTRDQMRRDIGDGTNLLGRMIIVTAYKTK